MIDASFHQFPLNQEIENIWKKRHIDTSQYSLRLSLMRHSPRRIMSGRYGSLSACNLPIFAEVHKG